MVNRKLLKIIAYLSAKQGHRVSRMAHNFW